MQLGSFAACHEPNHMPALKILLDKMSGTFPSVATKEARYEYPALINKCPIKWHCHK